MNTEGIKTGADAVAVALSVGAVAQWVPVFVGLATGVYFLARSYEIVVRSRRGRDNRPGGET